MAIEGNVRLQLIQGDSFEREIYIEGAELNIIEGIYFSCEKLKICKKLYLNGEYFVLNFTPEETINFPKSEVDYDLTVKFIDNKIETVSYRSQLTILPKINKVSCFG